MPVVSERQRRAMYAAEEGHSTLGIPQKVGAEFIGASHGVTDLPETKKPKKKNPTDYGSMVKRANSY